MILPCGHEGGSKATIGDMGALLDLSDAVARLETRLNAQDDSEEYRRELLRLTIREAVQDALAPLDKRLDDIEKDVTRAKTVGAVIGSAVTFLVPIATWLLPKLAVLLGIAMVGGC